MIQALSGLRVLDLSRILAGPFATQVLSDLGADVVKVESAWGDDTRNWGPPFVDLRGSSTSAYFASCNRGKRSIVLDLKNTEDVGTMKSLLSQADVLVENFRVGTLARMGFDPEELMKDYPGLIVCSITGFGQSGPRAKEAGYDVALQGMSGLMSITGIENGPPVKVGVAWIDVLTGWTAVSGILTALYHRERTGDGQWIDLSLFDVALMSMVNQAQNWLATGDSPRRMGHAHPNIVPYQAFEGSNGWFILATGNDAQHQLVCEMIGRIDLCEPPYDTNAGRLEHRSEIISSLAEVFLQSPIEDWLSQLKERGIPCAPIHSIGKAFADDQAKARGAIWELSDGSSSVANALRFMSATPASANGLIPSLDEHREEILRDWSTK